MKYTISFVASEEPLTESDFNDIIDFIVQYGDEIEINESEEL